VRSEKKIPIDEKSPILKTIFLPDETKIKIYKDFQIKQTNAGQFLVQYIRTTPGRLIFNQVLKTALNI
jgi:hypothetical protein